MIRQFELVEKVKLYDPDADEAFLDRAYVFAMKAHGTQKRASGDPYFSHPLEVADILTNMKLDTASIVTALLHDTVEDTDYTLDDIKDAFGGEVRKLVDGVTKLTRLELQSDSTKHAENLRKLVLAMSEDIRVLLVKLADRLHNMRTLHHIASEDKRRRIALETLEIYAPLAERIGMQQLKGELEDWSFGHINPDAKQSVEARLAYLREKGADTVGKIVAGLEKVLADAGIESEVSGREKSPYSIWQKMERKVVSFEQLFDIMAFRVIVDSKDNCYKALGMLHSTYTVVPGRFKDFISLPKDNGYQSIHTGVVGPLNHRVEVQIRTREMHEVAELGVAAHWSYKQGGKQNPTEGRQYRWLRELLDVIEHASSPEEFLEHTKLAMFQDQVFCFSPKGDLISLPQGATSVDFAYAVHSEVGDTCVGAKVNGRIVPLRTPLRNGDQVEILTSRAQTPSPTWERFVVTAKARARIRRFVRTQERQQYVTLGRSMLQKSFRQAGYEMTEKALEGVLQRFRASTSEDLMALVGQGELGGREVVTAVYPGAREGAGKTQSKERDDEKVVSIAKARRKAPRADPAVPLRGLIPGMAVHFAGCCHPLPGDRIVGIVTTGRGVTIHTIDCDMLEQFNDEPDRWIDVGWETGHETPPRVGRIRCTIANAPGSLASLCAVIGKDEGNITNLKIVNRSIDFFEMIVDIEVQDVKHLTNIIAALRATPAINSVNRARG